MTKERAAPRDTALSCSAINRSEALARLVGLCFSFEFAFDFSFDFGSSCVGRQPFLQHRLPFRRQPFHFASSFMLASVSAAADPWCFQPNLR